MSARSTWTTSSSDLVDSAPSKAKRQTLRNLWARPIRSTENLDAQRCRRGAKRRIERAKRNTLTPRKLKIARIIDAEPESIGELLGRDSGEAIRLRIHRDRQARKLGMVTIRQGAAPGGAEFRRLLRLCAGEEPPAAVAVLRPRFRADGCRGGAGGLGHGCKTGPFAS